MQVTLTIAAAPCADLFDEHRNRAAAQPLARELAGRPDRAARRKWTQVLHDVGIDDRPQPVLGRLRHLMTRACVSAWRMPRTAWRRDADRRGLPQNNSQPEAARCGLTARRHLAPSLLYLRRSMRDPLASPSLRRLALGTAGPTAHPTPPHGPVVALIRDHHLARWVHHELQHLGQPLRLAESMAELAAWSRTDTPRPRLLMVSLDEMEAEELCALRRLRGAGFTGHLVALSRSRIMPALRGALGITLLITAPFVQDVFADLLRAVE